MQCRLRLVAAVLGCAALGACAGAGSMSGALSENAFPVQPEGTAPRAYVRYFPQRDDDIAWENDRTAFRIYGPELETAAPPFSSGIDAWGKKVRTPVLNKWYTAGEHAYHYDRGEGMDGYKTGASRGAGGIGVWNAQDKKLYVSHDWGTYKILHNGPDYASFRVTYAPWRVSTPAEAVSNPGAPGRKVWQVTVITLPMGSNLNRITTTLYSNEPGDITVAVGLATHGVTDGILGHAGNGRITYWDKADSAPDDKNNNGYMGVAEIVNPAQLVGEVHTDSDNLLLIKAQPGVPFTYYAGACWSNGLDFHSNKQWDAYVNGFAAKF
ncbi:MAG TPA: DUF4861 family protein [Phycisphaerae bacterium]|nr:DUF4861 family protein [Phycisphaerae bacterium]